MTDTFVDSDAGHFDQPNDVTTCTLTGNIIVADWFNRRLQILDKNLRHTRDVTKTKGRKNMERPHSVCTTSRGNIVALVEDEVHMFGRDGAHVRCLDGPWINTYGVTSDADFIYVSDADAHCVRVFTNAGRALRTFGDRGMFPSGPRHIAVCNHPSHGQIIIVTGCRTIYYLSKRGKLIQKMEDILDTDIDGLTTDSAGHVFITSTNNPILVIKDTRVVQRVGEVGAAHSWQLNRPCGLTTTPSELIVANHHRHNLLVFTLVAGRPPPSAPAREDDHNHHRHNLLVFTLVAGRPPPSAPAREDDH